MTILLESFYATFCTHHVTAFIWQDFCLRNQKVLYQEIDHMILMGVSRPSQPILSIGMSSSNFKCRLKSLKKKQILQMNGPSRCAVSYQFRSSFQYNQLGICMCGHCSWYCRLQSFCKALTYSDLDLEPLKKKGLGMKTTMRKEDISCFLAFVIKNNR